MNTTVKHLRAFAPMALAWLAMACSDPSGPVPPSPLCAGGAESVFVWEDFGATPTTLPYSGAATIADIAQDGDQYRVTLSLDDGTDFTFTYSIGPGQRLPLLVGENLDAYLDIYRPFWSELVVVLRQPPPPDGGRGALIAAMWNTSDALPGAALPEFALRYDDPGCTPSDWGCGDVAPLALYAEPEDGTPPIAVAAGDAATLGEYTLVNGAGSERFVGQILCTDTPGDWYMGSIRPTP